MFSALKNADEPTLLSELDNVGVNSTLRKLLTSLIGGDSKGALEAGNDCVTRATKVGSMQFAALCSKIVAGLHRAHGNIPAWANVMLQARALSPEGRVVFGSGYDVQDYNLLASLPAPIWSVPDLGTDGLVVDVVGGLPIIEIEINGKRIRALIDTGTDVALIVKKGVAEEIGAMPVVREVDVFQEGEVDGKRENDIFLADVKIGPVLVKNIGTVSSHTFNAPGYDAFIGLPFLERLGKVTFTEDRASVPKDECKPQRMLRSTGRTGLQRLMLPIELGGSSRVAMFDTGMRAAFAIQAQAPKDKMPPERLVQTSIGDRAVYADDLDQELTVLGVPIGSISVRRQYSPVLPMPMLLGMGALNGRSTTMDFSKGQACMR